MNETLLNFLFSKHILVSDVEASPEVSFHVLYALADKFGIKVTRGENRATEALLPYVANARGRYVPEAFYRGFPESVKALSSNALIFDQLLQYYVTYGLRDFSNPGHSVFEASFEREAFDEDVTPIEFVILSTEEAEKALLDGIQNLLRSSRPISDAQYAALVAYIDEYSYEVKYCAGKSTLVRLLCDKRDANYARLLSLPDLIKVVDYVNYTNYGSQDIKKLNFRNADRRFISALLDVALENESCNIRDCFEKKAAWCGLLHHLHYKPKSITGERFVALMRGKGNQSVFSEMERKIAEGDICGAADYIRFEKGEGAYLRNLNYLVSRAKSEEEIEYLVSSLNTKSPILLIQLMLQYAAYTDNARVFKFTRHNLLKIHTESDEELSHRRSVLPAPTVDRISAEIKKKLASILHGKLGKVYISPEMYKVAVPVQEGTSSGGLGVLPKGTRIPIPADKIIRAFTYWEKVNDIDLSVIGLDENGGKTEFSWRTMAENQSEEIAYSGDQTSGYDGGSEFFDVDTRAFKKKRKNLRYLVFCNNVYSGTNFSQCVCTAGYMLRDSKSSGEIYEPKTVKSSFTINCESTYAYLFAIDLKSDEFVWLNVGLDSNQQIAGESPFSFLQPYFDALEVINLGTLYEMLATELVGTPEEADVIVSDNLESVPEGAQVVRSCDIEKVTAILG